MEVQRLHEDTEDNDGENPLRRWSTTKGNNYFTTLNDGIKNNNDVPIFNVNYFSYMY